MSKFKRDEKLLPLFGRCPQIRVKICTVDYYYYVCKWLQPQNTLSILNCHWKIRRPNRKSNFSVGDKVNEIMSNF